MIGSIRILLWGCGEYAEKNLKKIEDLGYKIEGFIDTKYKAATFYGYPLLDLKKTLADISNVDFLGIMSTSYLDDIYKCALENGVPSEKIKVYLSEREEFGSVWEFYGTLVYSQYGEECYLRNLFAKKKNGFYVDVGAHHPYRFSNTYWAYKLGWKGINIEPNKLNWKLFQNERPNDINLNCGILDCSTTMKYYEFGESALNTFSKKMANFYEKISEGGGASYHQSI